ncbi:hypothetical protein ACFL4Z_04040, partial [candidate division KSB1 bacterium]
MSENPATGIEKIPESSKREVHLSVSQAKELIAALPHPWDSITEFAIYTSWRAGNILRLCIEDVEEIQDRHNSMDPAAKVILRNMKGGRTEVFPLSDAALEVVKHNCKGRCTGSVFVNPRTGNAYNNVSG